MLTRSPLPPPRSPPAHAKLPTMIISSLYQVTRLLYTTKPHALQLSVNGSFKSCIKTRAMTKQWGSENAAAQVGQSGIFSTGKWNQAGKEKSLLENTTLDLNAKSQDQNLVLRWLCLVTHCIQLGTDRVPQSYLVPVWTNPSLLWRVNTNSAWDTIQIEFSIALA